VIRNMLESFLIMCLLNFYTSQILTSTFCIIECISRLIKVTDCNNARWKLEINLPIESLYKKEPKLEGRVSRKEKYLAPCIAVQLQVVVLVGHTPLF
jgi:hypothetical protein